MTSHNGQYLHTDRRKKPEKTKCACHFHNLKNYVKRTGGSTWLEDLEGTANEVELLALIKAMEHLTADCDIELYTESRFISSGIDWLAGWKEKGWKTAKGQDIAHKPEWQQLDELLSGREILVHCKEDHSFRKWQQFELERLKR